MLEEESSTRVWAIPFLIEGECASGCFNVLLDFLRVPHASSLETTTELASKTQRYNTDLIFSLRNMSVAQRRLRTTGPRVTALYRERCFQLLWCVLCSMSA